MTPTESSPVQTESLSIAERAHIPSGTEANTANPASDASSGGPRDWLPTFGWIHVLFAAFAMVATLPGRTQGLGLVNEPILQTFGDMSRTQFAQINLWATLLGALFCIPIGRLLDRWNPPAVTAGLFVLLGTSVLIMANAQSVLVLSLGVFLSRGIGQSALSVASIAYLGRSFPTTNRSAAAVYAVLTGALFAGAFLWIGGLRLLFDWRTAWSTVAYVLIAVAPLYLLLATRFQTQTSPPPPKNSVAADQNATLMQGLTLRQTLRTSGFWILMLGASLYGLAASGLGLNHESILAERGFDAKVYHTVQSRSFLAGMVSQLICAWLVRSISYSKVLAAGLVVYAAAVGLLPFVTQRWQVDAYGFAMGAAGGAVTLVFFGAWRVRFGERELGRITGAAQLGTVLASAVGPLFFALVKDRFAAYTPALWGVAIVALIFAFLAWRLPGDHADFNRSHIK